MASTSTKSRAADKAAEDQAAQQQPEPQAQADQPKPELCRHDLDPGTCAECNGSAAAEQEQSEPQPEPEPSLPTCQLSAGRYPYWLHRPRITAEDGTEHQCGHRDGHVKIKDAMVCARALGREFELTLPDPDPSWADGGPGEPVA
jgi:hypothetical protein